MSDALHLAGHLARQGCRVSAGYFNPPGEPPEQVFEATLALILGLADEARVSIKAPALACDPERVERLARAARMMGRPLLFDQHGPETAEAVLELALAARRAGAEVGVALAARWPRSAADLERAIRGDLSVRVVKGEWPDTGPWTLASPPREALRRAFVDLARRAVGRARSCSLATHDAEALERVAVGLDPSRAAVELELLLGLPAEPVQGLASRFDLPVRWYVPFGVTRPPYLRALRGGPFELGHVAWLASDLVWPKRRWLTR